MCGINQQQILAADKPQLRLRAAAEPHKIKLLVTWSTGTGVPVRSCRCLYRRSAPACQGGGGNSGAAMTEYRVLLVTTEVYR